MFERKPPIRSTQEDVVELAEEIDRFVIGLAERIDAIQDAELAQQPSVVSKLARSLAREADRLGYPGMAMSAKGVALGAEDGLIDDLQQAVVELTGLAGRGEACAFPSGVSGENDGSAIRTSSDSCLTTDPGSVGSAE